MKLNWLPLHLGDDAEKLTLHIGGDAVNIVRIYCVRLITTGADIIKLLLFEREIISLMFFNPLH